MVLIEVQVLTILLQVLTMPICGKITPIVIFIMTLPFWDNIGLSNKAKDANEYQIV